MTPRCFVLAALVAATAGPAGTQALTMDAGFDADGWKALAFAPVAAGYNFDRAYASCPGPNGTQIVSGLVRGGAGSDWIGVVRLLPDGSLDPAYGSAGRQFIALGTGAVNPYAHAALCVGGGRTVIARAVSGGSSGACAIDATAECNLQLLRITADGQLDPSFGSGGVVSLDLDTVRTGLAGLEAPLGLNRAANGQLLLTGAAQLTPASGAEYRAFVARFSADGVPAGASVPDVPGLTGYVTASAADYGPNGDVWLVGEGETADGQRAYYLSVLDAATLQPSATIRGSGGDYLLQGARLLRPGVLVAGATYRPFGASGPRTPRLVVFRQGGISTLDLPPSQPVDGVPTGAVSSVESIMALDANHVLYSTLVGKQPGDAWSSFPGVHVALARIGTSVADDAALPADSATLSYRSPDGSCAGHAGDQANARVSLWNGLPVLVGGAWRACNPASDADWLIARFKPDYLFGHGFE